MNLKLKKGDKVIVITGSDKGVIGEVISSLPKENKLLVKGVNIKRKSVKPSQMNPNGGLIEFEKPINISNVSYLDPKLDMPTKIGFKFLDDGKKVRYAKKSGEIIDNLKS